MTNSSVKRKYGVPIWSQKRTPKKEEDKTKPYYLSPNAFTLLSRSRSEQKIKRTIRCSKLVDTIMKTKKTNPWSLGQ